MIYARHVLAHLRKDLRLEWRNRDSINGMLFFALLVVVVFALAFDPTAFPTIARQISGGLLWVGVLFASITALNNAWTRELNHGVLDAHRLSPAPASALFVGKALANFLFVTAVEIVLAPVFAVFDNLLSDNSPVLAILKALLHLRCQVEVLEAGLGSFGVIPSSREVWNQFFCHTDTGT